MKRYRVVRIGVLLALLLGSLAPQFAQNAPAGPEKPDAERHWTAINLIRAINTAEVLELQVYGSFAPWETLLTHHTEYIEKCARQSGVRLGLMPEVLPGWTMRLNVRSDGRAYDLMFRDLASKQELPYGAYSNESGIIWDAAPVH